MGLIFFTLPITILTLGFLPLVINGLIAVADIGDRQEVLGQRAWGAVLGSILISIVSWAPSGILLL